MLGNLSPTVLLTRAVTKPPGERQGLLVQETFNETEGSRELKSLATSAAAEFAARFPEASFDATTNARDAVRAAISVDRNAVATTMLAFAMIEMGTNSPTVIAMNSTITFPFSDFFVFTAPLRQVLLRVQLAEIPDLEMGCLLYD
jgi:hypothetical protein